jgi:hypothetical protein
MKAYSVCVCRERERETLIVNFTPRPLYSPWENLAVSHNQSASYEEKKTLL